LFNLDNHSAQNGDGTNESQFNPIADAKGFSLRSVVFRSSFGAASLTSVEQRRRGKTNSLTELRGGVCGEKRGG
jgi:hypothetical protein